MKNLIMAFFAALALNAQAAGLIAWTNALDHDNDGGLAYFLMTGKNALPFDFGYIAMVHLKDAPSIYGALNNGAIDISFMDGVLGVWDADWVDPDHVYYTDELDELTPGQPYEVAFIIVRGILDRDTLSSLEFELEMPPDAVGMYLWTSLEFLWGSAYATDDIYNATIFLQDMNNASLYTSEHLYIITPIPEPATGLLALCGIALLLRRHRK